VCVCACACACVFVYIYTYHASCTNSNVCAHIYSNEGFVSHEPIISGLQHPATRCTTMTIRVTSPSTQNVLVQNQDTKMDPNIVVPRILLRAIMIIRVMPPSKENVLVKLSHKIEKHRPKHCRTWISAASDSDYSSHVPLH